MCNGTVNGVTSAPFAILTQDWIIQFMILIVILTIWYRFCEYLYYKGKNRRKNKNV